MIEGLHLRSDDTSAIWMIGEWEEGCANGIRFQAHCHHSSFSAGDL
jgi:hypothetical protein